MAMRSTPAWARTCAIGAILAAMILCGPDTSSTGAAYARDDAAKVTSNASFAVPFVAENHPRMRALVSNAFEYVAPGRGTIDPASGYPVEGWNEEPRRGLFLRSFTQLTAIGVWIDLLANIATGRADNPYISRQQALDGLLLAIQSLRHDQRDPAVSADGLLGNFLGFDGPRRVGPLASEVAKADIIATFGPNKGSAIWQALVKRRWIVAEKNGLFATIQRGPEYGRNHFDGALAAFGDNQTADRIVAILDRRVVMAAYGDNANLSASIARAIGALMRSPVRDTPAALQLRVEMERFLENQRPGYKFLFDPKAGMFRFGWNASNGKFFGWEDTDGAWKVGHSDYLINEFRGPTMFVVLRYGMPTTAIANLGVKIKPYRLMDGRSIYTPAPWEGSAFQALGLNLSMGELHDPSWNRILKNLVDIELDYAARHALPGFLSEAYSGRDTEYTGAMGIPEITVSPNARIVDAPSLYTLGVAYAIAPDGVERLLDANWEIISGLLTDHGPWEGYNTTTRKAIRFQTTVHVLCLILGVLNTASDDMAAYLNSKGLRRSLDAMHAPGQALDLLSGTKPIAWTPDQSVVRLTRDPNGVRLRGASVGEAGITLVRPSQQRMNLSGGLLTIGYRARHAADKSTIRIHLKTAASDNAAVIPSEIFLDNGDGGNLSNLTDRQRTVQIPLPATPALANIREVAVVYRCSETKGPLDLSFTVFRFAPFPHIGAK